MKWSAVIVPAPEFASAAASRIVDVATRAIAARGHCSIALCGGKTPVPVFEDVAARPLDWRHVAVYFGDERAVPPDHPDSNFRMARHALLDRITIPMNRVFRMEAERPDRDQAARDYDALMPPELDLLLLGVGPDGHTASLFPYSPALAEADRRVLAVARPPLPLQPQVDRMTITPPVIGRARQVIVMVAGGDKAALIAQILAGPERVAELPAQLARRGTWILDQAAASQLHTQDN